MRYEKQIFTLSNTTGLMSAGKKKKQSNRNLVVTGTRDLNFNYLYNFMIMNKKRKFTSIALAGALFCGIAGTTFVGCKDYDDDIDHVQQQIDELKGGSIASMDSQIKELKQGQTDLKGLITNIQTEIETLKAGKDAYIAADNALEARLKEAIKNGTDGLVSQADLKATMAEVNAMKEKFTELDDAFAQMLEEFENAFGPMATATSSIGDFANSLSKIIQALTDRVSEINARVIVCETSISTLNSQITAINDQITENQNNFADFSKATLEKIQNVSDNLEKVKVAMLDTIYSVEGRLNESLQALDSKIDGVQSEFEGILGDYVKITVFKDLETRFARLEAKMEVDSIAIEEKIEKLNDLAKDFVTNEALKSELQGIKADITTLQNKKVTLAGMLTEAENQNAFDTRVNDLIKAALEDMGPEGGKIENLEDLVAQVQANAAAVSTLTTKYNDLTGRVSALENRIQSIVFAPQHDDEAVYFYTLNHNGSKIANASSFTARFKVYPLSYNLKDSVNAGKATLAIDYYQTRAVNAAKLECIQVEPVANEQGLWEVTIKKSDDLIGGFKAALAVTYNKATLSSDYFTIDNKEITLTDLEEAIFTEKVKEQSVKYNKKNHDLGLPQMVLGFEASYQMSANKDYVSCDSKNRQISLSLDPDQVQKDQEEIGKKFVLSVTVTVAGASFDETIDVKVANADENNGLKRLVLVSTTNPTSYYLEKVNPSPQPSTYYYAKNGNLIFKYKIDPVDYTLPVADLKFDLLEENNTMPVIKVVSSKQGEIVARIENNGWQNNRIALNYGDVYSDYKEINEEAINVDDILIINPDASELPALVPTGEIGIPYDSKTEIVLVDRQYNDVNFSSEKLAKTNYRVNGNTKNQKLSEVGFVEDITYEFVGDHHIGFELSTDKKAIKAKGDNTSSLIDQTCTVRPVLKVTSVDGTTTYTKTGASMTFRLTASTSLKVLADYTWPNVVTVDADPTEIIDLSAVSQWNVDYLRQIAEALGKTTADLTIQPTIIGIKHNGAAFANTNNEIASTGVLPVITIQNTLQKGDYIIAYKYETTDALNNVKIATVNVKFTIGYETFDPQELTYVPGWWSENNTRLTFAGQAVSGVWNMLLKMDEVLKLTPAATAKAWSIEYKEVNGNKINITGSNLEMKNPDKIKTEGSANITFTIKNSGGNVIYTSAPFVVTFVDPIQNAIAERKAVQGGYTGPKHAVSNAANNASIEILEHLTWKDARRNSEMIDNTNKQLDGTSETLYGLGLTAELYSNAACTVPFTDNRASLTNNGKFTWTPTPSGAEFTKIQLYVKLVITTTYGDYSYVYPIAVEK